MNCSLIVYGFEEQYKHYTLDLEFHWQTERLVYISDNWPSQLIPTNSGMAAFCSIEFSKPSLKATLHPMHCSNSGWMSLECGSLRQELFSSEGAVYQAKMQSILPA